jgi:hypothetical protein
MPIPAFRDDGSLPEGLHEASEEEVIARFGESTARREYLTARVRRWLELARAVGAHGLVIDGSFVTDKAEPNDVDAAIWLPDDFRLQAEAGKAEAVELQTMVLTLEPRELFGIHSRLRWENWLAFFSHTREFDERLKGIVEVKL